MINKELAQKIANKGVAHVSEANAEAVRMLNRISVHSEVEDFPEKFFADKAPNETDAQRNYRKKSYRPITHREWSKAEAKLNRVFNSQNYSIDWAKVEGAQWSDDQPSDYFDNNYPEYGSITNYFQSVVKHEKIVDPNAIITVKPEAVPWKDATNEEGEVIKVVDQSVAIDPIAVIYRSDQIVRITEGSALVLSTERSKLKDDRDKRSGLVFEYWTEFEYGKLIQVGRKQDYNFEQHVLWNHDLEELPVKRLKGKVVNYKGQKIYKSVFYDSISYLDTALYNWSTLQASIVDNVYLERWEYVDECDAQGCLNGKVQADDGIADCKECNGTGHKNVGGIFSSYKIRKPSATEESIDPPPFGYVFKNPAILNFLEQHVESNINQAFEFISVEDQAGGNETATGRSIDREDLFSFMLDFSSEIFSTLKWTIDIIGRMRYGNAWEAPSINPPTEFSFKSARDIINELNDSEKTPSIAKRQILSEFINKKFEGSPDKLRKAEIWLKVDRLATLTNDQIATGINRTVAKWEVVLHDSFAYIYNVLVEEGEITEESELTDIREEMRKRAKLLAADIGERRIDPEQIIGDDA